MLFVFTNQCPRFLGSSFLRPRLPPPTASGISGLYLSEACFQDGRFQGRVLSVTVSGGAAVTAVPLHEARRSLPRQALLPPAGWSAVTRLSRVREGVRGRVSAWGCAVTPPRLPRPPQHLGFHVGPFAVGSSPYVHGRLRSRNYFGADSIITVCGPFPGAEKPVPVPLPVMSREPLRLYLCPLE